MKEGFFIIKPDLFDSKEMVDYMSTQLEENFDCYEIYKIKEYGKFCKDYREYDIANTDMSPSERILELKRTEYATFAYKDFYKEQPAYAVVVREEDEDFLYEKLSQIKTSVRSRFKQEKKFHLYVDISQKDNWKVYRHNLDNNDDQEYIDRPDVKLAYMNGVHVEEFDLFKRNIGMKFLYEYGVISPKNRISQDVLTGGKNEKDCIQ